MRKQFFKLLFVAVLAFAGLKGRGQTVTPLLLRSNSTSIDVREGKNFRKGYWTVSPDLPRDVYYTHRFSGQTSLTFISDVDSISFNVVPGQTIEFVILLNGKYRCNTEISTLRTTYFKNPPSVIDRDTIPFEFGRDNRIYIKGSINNSAPLKFMFDNGADNTIVFPSAFGKGMKVFFDDSIQNNSTGGTSSRRTSNRNHLQLGKMNWKDELVMLVDKQMGDDADGTIGYDIFEDKLLEINYDLKIMIAHDKPFAVPKDYEAFKMDLSQSQVPYLKTTMVIEGSDYKKSLMFDMGATGCLFLNNQYVTKNRLDAKMKLLGSARRSGAGAGAMQTETANLPLLKIGRFSLYNLPVSLQILPGFTNSDGEELGMEVLRRFNTILDYQNNMLYLAPNKLFESGFRQPQN